MTREFTAEELWLHSSFEPVLRHVCQTKYVGRILEWGPGPSTILMAELCPKAQILTIEHDNEWADKFESDLKQFPKFSRRIQLERIAIGGNGESEGYVCHPFCRTDGGREWKFDLIFIDGRQRADCLAIASALCYVYGVVILHDAHRENYFRYSSMFNHQRVFEKQRTAVFSHNDLDCYFYNFEEKGFNED